MPSPRIIKRPIRCPNRLRAIMLHLWQNLIVKISLLMKTTLQVLIQLSIAQLIRFLKFTILSCMLLYGIVSEMNQWIFTCFEAELCWRSSYISLLEPITLKWTVNACYKHVMSDVELTLVVEKWVLDVFLDDKGSEFPISVSLSAF